MDYFDILGKTFGSIGGLGFLVGVLILWKTGLLEYLLNLKKNGNNGNGEQKGYKEIKDMLVEIGNHNHHESLDSLKRIEETLYRIERRFEKVEEIAEGIIYIKAKINGGKTNP